MRLFFFCTKTISPSLYNGILAVYHLLSLSLVCELFTFSGTKAIMSVNSICCFNEINIRIPLKRLESYFWTSSSCPFKHIYLLHIHVVLMLLSKNLFCMDPEYKWVQRAINYLDKKHA
uniref:Chemokine interleukin-8-like domain-containing protein n=1 Tax=Sinocyclocheilus anshuiensis TaxID=1608454 RepID=A0A671KW03_9TELE